MTATYEQARAWALALPGVEEVMVEEWGHPTLRVNNKMFASGTEGGRSMTVKASREEQAELIRVAPGTFSSASYVGRFGWVEVALATVDPEELRDLVTEAWKRTAPKKMVRAYEQMSPDP